MENRIMEHDFCARQSVSVANWRKNRLLLSLAFHPPVLASRKRTKQIRLDASQKNRRSLQSQF